MSAIAVRLSRACHPQGESPDEPGAALGGGHAGRKIAAVHWQVAGCRQHMGGDLRILDSWYRGNLLQEAGQTSAGEVFEYGDEGGRVGVPDGRAYRGRVHGGERSRYSC
jgi:hypothetical protein